MVTLSVVLPNYNYARYLDQRITSLLNQTFTDFELIILDDASTDNSREVIQKYAGDPRVRLQFYEKNSGQVYQRWNDGAKLARGQYLLFAGADDFCDERLFERVMGAIKQSPDIGFAFCNSYFVDERGDTIGMHHDPKSEREWSKDFVDGPEFWMRQLETAIAVVNAGAVVFRRDAFEREGGFSEKYWLVSDWMLYVALGDKWKIAYVAEPLNYFRQHPKTARETSSKNALSRLKDISQAFLELSRYDRLTDELRPYKTKWLAEIFLRALPRCTSPRAVGTCVAAVGRALRYDARFPIAVGLATLRVISRRLTFGK